MNRAQYQATRRALRQQLRPAYPSTVEQFKQPLRAGNCRDQVVTARERLARLNGVPVVSRQTPRQVEIQWLAKAQAQRNAERAALKALRDAGADEADVRHADWLMRYYGAKPEAFLRRAAELRELRS